MTSKNNNRDIKIGNKKLEIIVVILIFSGIGLLKLYEGGYYIPTPWITSIESFIVSAVIVIIIALLLSYKFLYPIIKSD